MKQYHLNVTKDDVGSYVIMPGDPKRVQKIARFLNNPIEVGNNREYCTYTSTLEGEKVSVVSSGIGGPSTAIAVEELRQLGVHTIVRTGTCGLLQPDMKRGDIVIATGCYRGGATANAYVPVNFPAIADFGLVATLCRVADEKGVRYRAGIIESKDAFFLETPQALPMHEAAESYWKVLQRAGVLATEMESDTLFVVALLRGIRAASVLCGIGSHNGVADMTPMSEEEVERHAYLAVETLRRTIKDDRNKSSRAFSCI